MSISGYSDVLSPQPGGALNLYVGTDAPQVRVGFYWCDELRVPEIEQI